MYSSEDAKMPSKEVWMRHALSNASSITISISIILGTMWIVAKPSAEKFIKDTVAQEKFATQRSLDDIERRAERLEQKTEEVLRSQEEQARTQESLKTDMESVKSLLREQREDQRLILRLLGRTFPGGPPGP